MGFTEQGTQVRHKKDVHCALFYGEGKAKLKKSAPVREEMMQRMAL
jgi:hypothetical protein